MTNRSRCGPPAWNRRDKLPHALTAAFIAVMTIVGCSPKSDKPQSASVIPGAVILTDEQRQHIHLYAVAPSKWQKTIEATGATVAAIGATGVRQRRGNHRRPRQNLPAKPRPPKWRIRRAPEDRSCRRSWRRNRIGNRKRARMSSRQPNPRPRLHPRRLLRRLPQMARLKEKNKP